MVKYTWIKKSVPKELLVKQIYGIVFSNDGNILLRVDNNKYKFRMFLCYKLYGYKKYFNFKTFILKIIHVTKIIFMNYKNVRIHLESVHLRIYTLGQSICS